MKKIFSILIIFAFLTSYFLKNFQILLLSLCLLTLFGLLFKKINKNFIISIFSILITITIIEISLKYKSGKKLLKLSNSKNLSKNIKYQKSPLGYNPLPGVQNHLKISNGKKLIDSNYTIKKDGFRKTPQIKENSKNTNVNFFGGSFIFGWGLNDNETLPYLIQNYFNSWKVRNYGINGYGVHQMLTQITNDKKNIGDINFLITQSSHIPRSACKKDYSFGTPRYTLNAKNQIIRSGYCNNFFIENLQLPKIFGSIINRSEIKKIIDIYFLQKSQFTQNDIKLYTGIIKKINKKILKENKYFFVGYIRTKTTEIDTKILNYFKDNQINFVDLTLANNENFELFDGHPNKKANLKRSEIIYTYLQDLIFK